MNGEKPKTSEDLPKYWEQQEPLEWIQRTRSLLSCGYTDAGEILGHLFFTKMMLNFL